MGVVRRVAAGCHYQVRGCGLKVGFGWGWSHDSRRDGLVYHSSCSIVCRAYLKSVAKKLAEDVDNLKSSASNLGKVSATPIRP